MKTNLTLLAALCCWFLISSELAPTATRAADEPGVVDKTRTVVQDAKASMQDAGRSAADSLENLWSRVDNSRLKYRTRDEIVAWIMMGVLVGAVAGMFTSLGTSGVGKVGRLLLGLVGALVGGIVVRAAQIDFGWGPVLIRYEELLFAFLGAVLLVILGRVIRSKARTQPAEK